MQLQIQITSSVWRYLVYFWNIFLYVVIILDFISVNHYSDLLDLVAVIYIAILSIYAGTKEFERWFSHYNAHHPGEVFIVSWTILLVILLVVPNVIQIDYHLPEIIIYCYISVLTILALTRRSRSLYYAKKNKKDILEN
ncbi:MAG: hypothetical protein WC579_02600 [Candidatus Paceibacterota bacterium]|nr:hypothetical protein [Candidatus Paceibacterota bacterium]HPD55543.1 hypothetical protein [Candidatus Paceibacterota bacterium]HQM34954.1 hypothetical protein [Candidatus Paceibacterota bacterium]